MDVSIPLVFAILILFMLGFLMALVIVLWKRWEEKRERKRREAAERAAAREAERAFVRMNALAINQNLENDHQLYHGSVMLGRYFPPLFIYLIYQ
jgi:hypothetical protein